jgi:hypothetical protein
MTKGKPRGHKGGRPSLPVARDPDRWDIAFIYRAILVAAVQGIPAARMIDTFVTGRAVARGEASIIEHPDDTLEARRRGRRGVWVYMPKTKHLAALERHNLRPPPPYRYKDAFKPRGEDLRRKLFRYLERPDDERQLHVMIVIVDLCLANAAGAPGAPLETARWLAEMIGESAHFEEVWPQYEALFDLITKTPARRP